MRKLQITATGEPADVLELVEFQAPAPGPGQVLVEVQAATINASDFLYITGQYFTTPRPPSDEIPDTHRQVAVRTAGCSGPHARCQTSAARR